MDQKKIDIMQQGGRLLAQVRDQLVASVAPGVTPLQLEKLACDLIAKTGGTPAFKRVPGYHYATCINVNDGLVHGIPTDHPFKNGDLVSLDLGLYYQGYYTDTSATVVAGTATPFQEKFIQTGLDALAAGIAAARVGNHLADISKAIEKVIKSAGFTPVHDLTGHGIGKRLHENPYVPNYYNSRHPNPTLREGQTLALEPMYTTGSADIVIDPDGWTIRTADGSLSGLVEHTIAITSSGPLILTAQAL